MKTLEEHKRQWEEVKAGLTTAYSAINMVDKDSPYAKHARDFAQQLHSMIQQAWLADSPVISKPSHLKKPRKGGRPKVTYIDDEVAGKRLVDVIGHIIETRFENGRMILDNGQTVPPSQFFACVYSSVYEHGMSKSNNLKEFANIMRAGVEQVEMAENFTLQYDAIYSQTKKWNILASRSNPYDFVHIYSISYSDIGSDEKRKTELRYWKALYDAVDAILIDEGLFLLNVEN